jgi:hypothetical protein
MEQFNFVKNVQKKVEQIKKSYEIHTDTKVQHEKIEKSLDSLNYKEKELKQEIEAGWGDLENFKGEMDSMITPKNYSSSKPNLEIEQIKTLTSTLGQKLSESLHMQAKNARSGLIEGLAGTGALLGLPGILSLVRTMVERSSVGWQENVSTSAGVTLLSLVAVTGGFAIFEGLKDSIQKNKLKRSAQEFDTALDISGASAERG